jgi:hypothetical protein
MTDKKYEGLWSGQHLPKTPIEVSQDLTTNIEEGSHCGTTTLFDLIGIP